MSLLFQPSSTTYGSAKDFVARQAGKKGTDEMDLRAGDSIRAAIQHWNAKENWSFLLTSASAIAVTSASDTYDLPYNFKDMYLGLITGQGSTWYLKNRDKRMSYRNAPNIPAFAQPWEYNLFYKGSVGQLALRPEPSAAATLNLDYYRKMTEPCNVAVAGIVTTSASPIVTVTGVDGVKPGNVLYITASPATYFTTPPTVTHILSPTTFKVDANALAVGSPGAGTVGSESSLLDIQADYEGHILAWAVHHFAISNGGNPERLTYWINYANEGLQTAIAAEVAMSEDMEISIEKDPDQIELWPRWRR